jgi:hypothetical protein
MEAWGSYQWCYRQLPTREARLCAAGWGVAEVGKVKIITVKYAIAYHDIEHASLDAVREKIVNCLLDNGAEVVSNIEGTERDVDVTDPVWDDDENPAAPTFEEWQEEAWEQPEFQRPEDSQ